jgi:asparagine synthetase B (glutamine-hydrolysing)
LGHAFVKLDKATAENQMESRCPFLDWDLMCFLRSIPESYWEKFNSSKYPLKKILKEAGFSELFIERKKIGFSYPFRYAMIFKYPYLKSYLKKNSAVAKTSFGIEMKNFSYFDLFKNFDFYWKIFILLKFLENNNLLP